MVVTSNAQNATEHKIGMYICDELQYSIATYNYNTESGTLLYQ
jgi:hypothetical protein